MAAPTITNGFVTSFGQDVHLEFNQRGSLLRPCVTTRGIIRAETARFYVMGNGVTVEKSRNGNIPNQDIDLSYVTATMVDRYWRKDIDELDVSKITAELRPTLVMDAAGAFGRYTDDQIIDALDAGASYYIGDYSTALGRNVALGGIRQLLNTGMRNDGQIFAIISPNMCSQLMTEDEFASADYVGADDLPYKKMGMDIRTWSGVHWITHIGINGRATTQARGLMFHKSAIGHAVNAEVQVKFSEKPEGWGWIAKGAMSMGAIAIDSTGIIEMRVNDNVALAADANSSSAAATAI